MSNQKITVDSQKYNDLVQENKAYQSQMQGLVDQVNKFTQGNTSNTAASYVCDASCQYNKTASQLKQAYINSQTNLATAPYQEQVAQKNYVVFTQGELAYDDMIEQQLSEKASILVDEFKEVAEEKFGEINTQISSYNGILINYNNIIELYKNYLEENLELTKNLMADSNNVLTNERKTYYEDQGTENLNFIYFYILIPIYIIVLLCFAGLSLGYPSQTNIKVKIAMIVFFIILPFISSKILGFLINIGYSIYNLLPKNVNLSS